MARYRRLTSGPEAQGIHDRVETILGRELVGVVVDVDGLQEVVLPDGETLSDQESARIEREYGLELGQRDGSVTERGGEVLRSAREEDG